MIPEKLTEEQKLRRELSKKDSTIAALQEEIRMLRERKEG